MATAPPEPEELEVRAHGEDGDARVTMDGDAGVTMDGGDGADGDGADGDGDGADDDSDDEGDDSDDDSDDDSEDDSDDEVVQIVSLGSDVKVRAVRDTVDDVTKAHATRHKSTRQSERGHMVD